ncbi:tok [Lepeophtheirus salmonis]|uniref:Tok n=1 Tax=Lepeophtheirus salmonis TaxID=72036 RepID=A0A7R8H2X4_LEPSM|nr:tok [Lepeophtheirus salmonis]CAF2836956.1 tok [Lepeophtheirus salmonis]
MPEDIKSSGNNIWVKFVSDGSVQKAGFSASFMKEYDECLSIEEHGCEHECFNTLGGYKCHCRIGYELHSDEKRCENACGGLIEASNGTIVSPSFPELYPANKKCIWEILAPPQWRITMNFTHFDIEGNNQDCEYDSLSLSSPMDSRELRKHGVFCGSRVPPLITSEGNILRLEFVSDNSVQKSGFAGIFFTDKDECSTNNGGCQHICRNTIEGGCKHEITFPMGEIFSPHFPELYPAKKDCIWIFSTTPGHRIKIIYVEFEMEPHQECAYDHLIMYDGHTTDDTILGRFCGSKLPHPIVASDDKLLLVFKSDASVQRRGFSAKHKTVCGGHLTAKEYVRHIYSHAKYGDANYYNKAECDWIVEAPIGKNVHLSFLTFEMEEENDCGYDFIEIFSGFDASGPSYGRFCGNKIPPEIISVDESLLLRFKSDDTINSKGFSAQYSIIDEVDNFDYDFGKSISEKIFE